MPQAENTHGGRHEGNPDLVSTAEIFNFAAAPVISSVIEQGLHNPVQPETQLSALQGGGDDGEQVDKDAKTPAWLNAHRKALEIFRDRQKDGKPLPKAVIINTDDDGQEEIKIVPKD